ncbi:CBD9-like protein [Microthyrium microscopicum]|uniref:CBD9-like protein n=1 Tax=Microthyrium microscopicum TaxID=703497 RepID=A0A6A6UIC4_9PEZI|nr:CBD9-like protein [Microthyrium microscopicum]
MARLLLLATSIAGALAQGTQSTTSAGITFQTYDSGPNFKFGIALPETPGEDFIGHITAYDPDGLSWASVSLGYNAAENSHMKGPLLVVAWNHEGKAKAAFRQAKAYVNPDVYKGPMTFKEIPQGTSVNKTHIEYTFLCSKCITGDDITFKKTDTTAKMGFAYSTNGISGTETAAAKLVYHGFGPQRRGPFTLNLTGAKSAKYSSWAEMAK